MEYAMRIIISAGPAKAGWLFHVNILQPDLKVNKKKSLNHHFVKITVDKAAILINAINGRLNTMYRHQNTQGITNELVFVFFRKLTDI